MALSRHSKRVLLVGETWVSAATHFKGFDQFGSVTFHSGAGPLARALEHDPKVAEFVALCRKGGTSAEEIETAEKIGLDTGIRVRHPLDPTWELPVWIANFILMDYGTGAIFGCPAHDARDFEFATKYSLPIKPVFVAEGAQEAPLREAYVPMKSEPVRYVHGFAGAEVQTGEAAVDAAIAHAEREGYGKGMTNYRLRDWGISRQRYWGCPIPIVHCAASSAGAIDLRAWWGRSKTAEGSMRRLAIVTSRSSLGRRRADRAPNRLVKITSTPPPGNPATSTCPSSSQLTYSVSRLGRTASGRRNGTFAGCAVIDGYKPLSLRPETRIRTS